MEELLAGQLRRRCDPETLAIETTDDLETLDEVIGQPRAVAAIELGVNIAGPGYNLFVHGPEGVGKRYLLDHVLERCGRERRPPDDLCYAHNFAQPERPIAMRLPAGRGADLRDDMEQLIADIQSSLIAAFESDEYQTRHQLLHDRFRARQEEALERLQLIATENNLGMLRSPSGIVFAPMRDGEVLPRQEFVELPETEQARINEAVETLTQQFREIADKIPEWYREWQRQMREHDEETTRSVVPRLIDTLREKYAGLDDVVAYLDAVETDVVNNAGKLIAARQREEQGETEAMLFESITGGFSRGRYAINLAVDHSETEHAPVVYEDNPTLQNLLGRVEHTARMGALTTDFRLIRAGALHRANGGYLVIDARRLLSQPMAWEGLKRTLEAGEIRVESLERTLGLVATVSLEPDPVPLDVKVILVGERRLYYLLAELDPEFPGLFKIAADFADQLERSRESEALFARVIATVARRESLRPLEPGAVARVIEQGSRIAADAEKLTTHFGEVADLLREANHLASRRGDDRAPITAADVERAIEAKIYRADRVRELIGEQLVRGTLRVDTRGSQVGQINGLSVLTLGDFSFGRPSRITARVRLGKGDVIDIEREVELGGPLHSKGVFILSSFLGGRYAADRPLPLRASVVFEQSYGGVEGDSASAAELFALLSAIAEIPIRQELAVTGSVDQHGRIQAIGGVNEKIEGFFDLCRRRGLTGDQGVIIPATNVVHLMLRSEVIDAVAAGTFHVYPIRAVDEGIELLTGVAAGRPDESGEYPAQSFNGQVAGRLAHLADRLAELGRAGEVGT